MLGFQPGDGQVAIVGSTSYKHLFKPHFLYAKVAFILSRLEL